MVRPDVAGRKVARAVQWLSDAEEILSRDAAELAETPEAGMSRPSICSLPFKNASTWPPHWVADDGLAPPEDAPTAFDVLAERGFIELKSADVLRGAAGLRNRIAHGYGDVDFDRIRADAKDGLPHLRAFLVAVSNAAGL